MKWVTVLSITFFALASCASMAPGAPEDRVRTFDSEPEAVEEAIRDYLFDQRLQIVSEGEGYLTAERPETNMAIGVIAGDMGGMTSKADFNWRETPEGTELRAHLYAEMGDGRRAESNQALYDQLFDTIREQL